MDITNPLHEYRSYSYHHILCACKTTAAAESLAGTLTEDLRDTVGAVQTPDDIKVINDYVVVMNGFKDGDAFIKNASWETLFAPNSSKNNRYITTTMALEGEMTIVEPKGFSLLETINNVSKKLKVDSTNITWALKTVFVGYKSDNTVDYIANLKPLIFMMYDIQAKFDVSGSEYYTKFIGVANGSAKLPCYNSVAPISLTSGAGATLKDVIGELVTTINDKYTKEVDKMKERAASKGMQLEGRKITYAIVLPPEYESYPVDNIVVSQRGNVDTAGNITFPKDANIEQMIHTVLRSSKKINEDAAQAKGTVDRIFKTFSETTFEGDDTGTMTITFYVKPYDVPKATSEETLNNGETTAIEYDYMYSGANVDILDFDIKMEFGMGFLQMLTVNNPLQNTNPVEGEPENTQTSQEFSTSGTSGKTSNDDNTAKSVVSVGTLYPSKKFDELLTKGVENNADAAAFDLLLSKHAQLETLEAKVKVLGNPLVLGDLNILPSELGTLGPIGSSKFAKWLLGPPLIKINVYVPANPNSLVVSDKFRKQFWYRGFYQVLSTRHTFDQGIFTQEHDMISMPLEDPVVNTNPEQE
ncbi:MAG: hypothetical protein JXR12_01435 [Neptunomonas phycophila]|uniref:hypothetical protein n=1 Tax=Neptunomonas phycophila TaxID=1572645 RepID=UPI003B8CECDC